MTCLTPKDTTLALFVLGLHESIISIAPVRLSVIRIMLRETNKLHVLVVAYTVTLYTGGLHTTEYYPRSGWGCSTRSIVQTQQDK